MDGVHVASFRRCSFRILATWPGDSSHPARGWRNIACIESDASAAVFLRSNVQPCPAEPRLVVCGFECARVPLISKPAIPCNHQLSSGQGDLLCPTPSIRVCFLISCAHGGHVQGEDPRNQHEAVLGIADSFPNTGGKQGFQANTQIQGTRT